MKNVLLYGFLITGCASIEDQAKIPIDLLNNRASLQFEVDGKRYEGTATLKRRPGVGAKIHFLLPDKTVLFQLDNCAREKVAVRPSGNRYTYHYRPSIFKEAEDSCIMQAQITTSRGEIQSAIIDWTDYRRLKSRVWCNDILGQETEGVFLCQNRAGKLMWIEFDEEVIWATNEGCNPLESAKYHTPNKVFELNITEGFCAYGFMNKNRERYRLTTFGYTTIREVKIEGDK